MELNIEVTDERKEELTIGARIALEDALKGVEPDMRSMRELIATFMQTKDGEWMSDEEAFAVLDRVKQKNFGDVFQPFIEALIENMVPKENGNSSSSASTTEAQPLGG
jgi:hypothetical protein